MATHTTQSGQSDTTTDRSPSGGASPQAVSQHAVQSAGAAAQARISQASPDPNDGFGIFGGPDGVVGSGAQVKYTVKLPPLNVIRATPVPNVVAFDGSVMTTAPVPTEPNPHWQVRNEEGAVVADASAQTFSFTWNQVGSFVLSCSAEGHSYTKAVTVKPAQQIGLGALDRTKAMDYDSFLTMRKATLAVESLGILPETGSVRSNIPNPVAGTRAPDSVAGTFTLVSPPKVEASHLHWYLSSPDESFMNVANYEGRSLVRVEGSPAYYLGSGPSTSFPFSERHRYDLVCFVSSGTHAPHEGGSVAGIAGQYHQLVVTDDAVRAHERANEQLANKVKKDQQQLAKQETAMTKMDPRQRTALRATYVAEEGGIAQSLQLFLGPASDGKRYVLVDLTPRASRIEFDGADQEGALREFEKENDYPTGYIELLVPGASIVRQIPTKGENDNERIATDIAVVGLVVAGALAVLGTGGLGLPVIAGGLSFAGQAFFSWEAEKRKTFPSYAQIWMDLGMMLGGGATAFNKLAEVTIGEQVLDEAGKVASVKYPGKLPVCLLQFAGGATVDIAVLANQIAPVQAILDQDLPPEQKGWAIGIIIMNLMKAGVAYAVVKSGYGIASEGRKLIKRQADNLDSKVWAKLYWADEYSPSPASVFMRPDDEHEGDAASSAAGHAQKTVDGPQLIGASGPPIVEAPRAPDTKAHLYHLMNARTSKRIWYAIPDRPELMAQDFFGYNAETIGGAAGTLDLDGRPLAGRRAYNLGANVDVWFTLMEPGTYDIVCIEETDTGTALAPVHRFRQVVTPAR